MTGNEQKMRDALRAEVSTVLPSADAWMRIQSGVVRQRRRRHVMQYGGLAAAASAAAVVTVLAMGGDGTPGPKITNPPATQPSVTLSSAPKPSPKATPKTSPTQAASPAPPPVAAMPDTFVAAVQRGDVTQLAVLDSSTGKVVRELDWDPGEFGINEIDVSPDRKWVYTVKSLGDACQATIVRIPLSGGRAEDVIDETGPDGAEVFSMALSGDGKQVAYLRNPQCDGGGPNRTELVVRDVESARETERLKFTEPAPHGFPRAVAWQPGADRLAIVFAAGDPDNVGLLELGKATDLNDVVLASGHNRNCHLGDVTFAGDQLFASENCEPAGKPWTSTVVQFDPSTGKLADRGPSYQDRYVVAMDADPNGQALIYAVAEGKDGTTEERWVYSFVQSGKPVEVLHSATRVDYLSW